MTATFKLDAVCTCELDGVCWACMPSIPAATDPLPDPQRSQSPCGEGKDEWRSTTSTNMEVTDGEHG